MSVALDLAHNAMLVLGASTLLALSLHDHPRPAAAPVEGSSTPRDSDSDDEDQDGVADATEIIRGTDPSIPGLFPGSFPHIPEPLAFDLVRGLGAKKGEFEVNTLALATFSPYGGLAWAPEIEWAFADRHALEFELPMHDGRVEALKLATQGTVRELRARFVHGWQMIGEYALGPQTGEFTALYLAGFRINRRLTTLMMFGPQTQIGSSLFHARLVANPSLFVDVAEVATLGLELNGIVDGPQSSLRAIPQFHLQLGRHFRVQLGGGVEVNAAGVAPVAALRVVVE